MEFDAFGITNVLSFARNIMHHPETWFDFALDPKKDVHGNLFFILIMIDLMSVI